MKKYDSNKDSGIASIGNIPTHWKVTKMKYNALLKNGYAFKSDKYTDVGIPVIRIGDVKPVISLEETKKVPAEWLSDLSDFLIRSGDILVALTGATIGKTSVYNLSEPALLNQRVGLLRVKNEYHSGFLSYLIRTNQFKQFVSLECDGGAQENIGKEELGRFFCPVPPFEEQVDINTYLDNKTSQMDILIQKKRQMIALLEEEKTAVINEAVTKGLDPDATMKDSGFEWLGLIPAKWEVTKLKWVANRITDGAHISPDTSSENYPFVSTVDIKAGRIDFEKCLMTSTSNYEYLVKTGCKPKVGDVLYSKDGTIGGTALIDYEKDFVVASSLIIITPNQDLILPDFLQFSLQSSLVTNYVEAAISGSALRRISINKVSNNVIVVPPVNEQLLIVSHLNDMLQRKSTLISRLKLEIQLMQEYRTALISEAVTGKIDVRDYQPEPINSQQLELA